MCSFISVKSTAIIVKAECPVGLDMCVTGRCGDKETAFCAFS